METIIVVMLKNKKNGFFEKELVSIPIIENEELIFNIFALKNENNIHIYLKLTTHNDVLDWEYDAIFDYYNMDVFQSDLNSIISVSEVENEYNPTWEIVIRFDNEESLKNDLYQIINLHNKELNLVYQIIKNKKGEYEHYE